MRSLLLALLLSMASAGAGWQLGAITDFALRDAEARAAGKRERARLEAIRSAEASDRELRRLGVVADAWTGLAGGTALAGGVLLVVYLLRPRSKTRNPRFDSFTADAAAKTGRGRRTVEEEVAPFSLRWLERWTARRAAAADRQRERKVG